MSLSPFDTFQSRFVTYLLNFPRTSSERAYFWDPKMFTIVKECIHMVLYTDICVCVWSVHSSNKLKVKVKVTLVQALRFFTGRTAHRGSRGIALPFHDHATRRR